MSFTEKWLGAVDKKNSVLCAGLDPAEYEMGRGDEGLSEGQNKRDFSLKYTEAVAQYCSAIKPNIQYFKDNNDMATLKEISELAHSKGMVVIDDSKLADLGSTNDAGFYYAGKRLADAATYSPFAGNIAEAAMQGKKRGVGVIGICLMSNPEFEIIKNAVVEYLGHGIRMYEFCALEYNIHGIEGLVIGAPSPKNHLKEEEIARARELANDKQLVLLPGIGKQGGEAAVIWKYFGPNNVIVNVGRSLMFPKDSWAETAKKYMEMLNGLRKCN